MTVQALIERILGSPQGDRMLDTAIAEALGWKRKVEIVADGETGGERKLIVWLIPGGEEAREPPHYTTNFQEAYNLMTFLVPGASGGFSWEKEQASVKLDDNQYLQAATPQLAICAAALHLALSRASRAAR